jgi:phosphoglucosamine mutase
LSWQNIILNKQKLLSYKNMKRLFGADGIRGKIDQYPFRRDDQRRLGQSLAQWWLKQTGKPVILLGTDTRESNQRIKEALVEGLTCAGVEVWEVGIIPTAAISYLVASHANLHGGLIISASHNPIFENGIKVFDGRGMKISDDQEKEIEDAFFSDELTELSEQHRRAYLCPVRGFIDQYAQALVAEFMDTRWRRDKILVDCAHGAAYLSAQTVLSGLGLHYILKNANPDGTNINSRVGSEHYRKFPHEFAREIIKSGAELGIAFDGDADRVVFVDRDGILYDGDMLLAIVAFSLQEQNALKNNRIVITQMSNSGLAEHLGNSGIATQLVMNGDKYITDVLVADDLSLGGEQIGHLIIHTDPQHVTGDGLRTALWVLSILSRQPGATLRDLTHGFKKWPQVNVSARLGDRMLPKTEVIPGLDELKQRVWHEIEDLTRFECRPASTEPAYRVMLEARATPLPVLAGYAYGVARYVQKSLGKLDEPVDLFDCVNGGEISPGSVPYSLE